MGYISFQIGKYAAIITPAHNTQIIKFPRFLWQAKDFSLRAAGVQ